MKAAEAIAERTTDAMFQVADKNKNGELTYDELVGILNLLPTCRGGPNGFRCIISTFHILDGDDALQFEYLLDYMWKKTGWQEETYVFSK